MNGRVDGCLGGRKDCLCKVIIMLLMLGVSATMCERVWVCLCVCVQKNVVFKFENIALPAICLPTICLLVVRIFGPFVWPLFVGSANSYPPTIFICPFFVCFFSICMGVTTAL